MSLNSGSNSDERLLSIAIIALSGAAFGSGMSMRVMDPMLVQLASDFSITLSTASQAIARSIAGATAASIIPLSMAWIGDVVPYEDRQPIL
eukprot:gene18665-25447_t